MCNIIINPSQLHSPMRIFHLFEARVAQWRINMRLRTCNYQYQTSANFIIALITTIKLKLLNDFNRKNENILIFRVS